MSDRIKSFQTAYRNLDLLPLIEPRMLKDFRVDYGQAALAELEQLIEDDDAQDGKTIFAGHRGCGKSTLLAEFGRQCQDRGFFSVFFSIADSIEMSDVNHITILFSIAVNLMAEAEKADVEISEAAKQSFKHWFANKTQTQVSDVGESSSLGFSFFKVIQNKLKAEATIRKEIKQEFERKVSELVAQLNAMAAAIQSATGKQVLVIIDDLDKLDLAVVREVYREHIKALFLPGFRIIYTTPVAALRDAPLRAMMTTETNDQIVEMPVAKLYSKTESRSDELQPLPKNRQTLCDILGKRIPAELIEADIAEDIVLKSGGVLRELIRLANKCCRICLRKIRREPDQLIKIDRAVFDQAVEDMRLDFETPLGKEVYKTLATTYDKLTLEDPKAQPFLDLLHGLHILEYRNGQIWYDLHPVVTDLMKLKKLI